MKIKKRVLSQTSEDVTTDALIADLMARIAKLDIHLGDYQEKVKDAVDSPKSR